MIKKKGVDTFKIIMKRRSRQSKNDHKRKSRQFKKRRSRHSKNDHEKEEEDPGNPPWFEPLHIFVRNVTPGNSPWQQM